MSKSLIQMDKKDALAYHVVPADPDSPIALQDFVYWDGSNYIAKPMNFDTNGPKFLGECEDIIPLNLYGDVFLQGGSDLSPNPPRNVVKVKRYGLRDCVLATGVAAHPYDPIYKWNASGDAQGITTVDPGSGTKIGYISPDQETIASASAGQTTRVIYHAVFPVQPVN